MSNTSKKKKFSFGKLLIWIVVIFVALHVLTDGESTESLKEMFDIGDSDYTYEPDNPIPQQSTPVNTGISDEERLPSVPKALWEHVYLTGRSRGSCSSFTGNIKLLVVFVNDPEAVWTDAQIEHAKQEISATVTKIQQDAASYNAELHLSAEYVSATAQIPLVRAEYKKWVDSALANLDLPTGTHETCLALEKQYGADEVPIIFCTSRDGRSFANTFSHGSSGNEYALIYGNTPELYHELCHTFGAEDYYFPKEVADLADTYLPNSIMKDSSNGVMDAMTAYAIGWTDTLCDEALQFLQSTTYLTHGYLAEQKALESHTGYVENHTSSSGIYTGNLVDGIRHGQGTHVWDDGSVYEGNWEHGLRHGQGRMTFSNGDVYDGQWEKGTRHGTGTYSWTSGNRYVGSFVNNMRQGQGTMYYTDGGQYTGQWVENERNGQGTLTYANGNVYTGSWSNGTFHGQGTFTWTTGDKYVGNFVDGKRHGQGTYYYSNGNRYEGQWASGERHGQGTMYYANGTSKTGTWDNGKFVG